MCEFPEKIKQDIDSISGCISGAISINELEIVLKKSGFKNIKIKLNKQSKEFIKDWADSGNIEDFICSAAIEAVK